MTTTASSGLLLLDHAFGKHLLDGEDEWRDVSVVVRSSFLLLYRELRRQTKRLASLDPTSQQLPCQATTADPTGSTSSHSCGDTCNTRWSIMQQQLELLREELRITKTELATLQRSLPPHPSSKKSKRMVQQVVTKQIAAYAQVHSNRDQKMHAKMQKLQSQVRAMRLVQHECEEIVVRTAEKQQRQLQQLHTQLNDEISHQISMESDVRCVVKPRIKRIEKHLVAMHHKMKKIRRRQESERRLEMMMRMRQGDDGSKDQAKGTMTTSSSDGNCNEPIKLSQQSAEPELTFSGALSPGTSCTIPSINHATVIAKPQIIPETNGAYTQEQDQDQDDATLPPLSLHFHASTTTSTTGSHASLLRRYQHEKHQQLLGLDRLRRASTNAQRGLV